jgi:uncharacterized cupin superfamily protein
MTEAHLERADGGWLEPRGDGWFVLNARDAGWSWTPDLGWYCSWESRDSRFPEFGINLNVMEPGQPMAMYHDEPFQEGFLVLHGEALLIIEGEERPLRRWDYVHCPRDVPHVIVGAGDGPSIVLAVGNRVGEDGGSYPFEPVAVKHGAGAEQATTEPREAYARFTPPRPATYRDGLLP